MGFEYLIANYDPNWVDVKKELPKEGETVIFYSKRYSHQAIAEFKNNTFVCFGSIYKMNEVSHWQPLLLPPQSEVEQNIK